MVSSQEVERRLARIGVRPRFWSRPEIEELTQIIMPDEEIVGAVTGHHEGGFALFVATDRRLLLIDKKMFFLWMEDIRYDMIAEVDYFSHIFEATVTINTINKALKFISFRRAELRKLTSFIQERVTEVRQSQVVRQPQAVKYGSPHSASDSYIIEHTNNEQQTLPAADSLLTRGSSGYPKTAVTVRRRISKFFPSA